MSNGGRKRLASFARAIHPEANPHRRPRLHGGDLRVAVRKEGGDLGGKLILGIGLTQARDIEAVAVFRSGISRRKQDRHARALPWWKDGSPDLSRHKAKNTPYSLDTQRSGGNRPEELECRKPRFSTSTVHY